jgi:hypothetical protein
MLIMGGNKAGQISQHPVLAACHQKFVEYLEGPNTRLMVIGYSFGDQHINDAIVSAARKGGLSIFLVGPSGIGMLENFDVQELIRGPQPLLTDLGPHVIGVSRRSLTTTFRNDRAEHAKLMRFFDG